MQGSGSKLQRYTNWDITVFVQIAIDKEKQSGCRQRSSIHSA